MHSQHFDTNVTGALVKLRLDKISGWDSEDHAISLECLESYIGNPDFAFNWFTAYLGNSRVSVTGGSLKPCIVAYTV